MGLIKMKIIILFMGLSPLLWLPQMKCVDKLKLKFTLPFNPFPNHSIWMLKKSKESNSKFPKVNSKVLDATHHQYLRNEPDSVWMPYSYTGDWSRNGYVITNQMKRTSASKTIRPLVSFEFVNDFDLMSITSDDMNKFLTNLRYNS